MMTRTAKILLISLLVAGGVGLLQALQRIDPPSFDQIDPPLFDKIDGIEPSPFQQIEQEPLPVLKNCRLNCVIHNRRGPDVALFLSLVLAKRTETSFDVRGGGTYRLLDEEASPSLVGPTSNQNQAVFQPFQQIEPPEFDQIEGMETPSFQPLEPFHRVILEEGVGLTSRPFLTLRTDNGHSHFSVRFLGGPLAGELVHFVEDENRVLNTGIFEQAFAAGGAGTSISGRAEGTMACGGLTRLR